MPSASSQYLGQDMYASMLPDGLEVVQEEEVPVHFLQAEQAQLPEIGAQLRAQQANGMIDPGLARQGRGVVERTADEDELRPKPHSLQDVRAAPEATVDHDSHITGLLNCSREGAHRRHGAVELP